MQKPIFIFPDHILEQQNFKENDSLLNNQHFNYKSQNLKAI